MKKLILCSVASVFAISSGRFDPVRDLFVHAKDLFVQPNAAAMTGQLCERSD
jgi:hypothetical protein